MLTTLIMSLVVTNSPEAAADRTRDEILLKLSLRCDAKLTVRYDEASLKQHNQDIRYDQTGGDLECNEPLRYLWALCATSTGKAVVKKNELREVVCQGTPKPVGSLTIKAGVITVERAFEERQSFVRARKEFEQALKTQVAVEVDPYGDEAWNTFRREPNPVLSTTDYCLVDGAKVEFDWSIIGRASSGKSAKTVKCLEAGKVVIDVTLDDRKPTGLVTHVRDSWRRRYQVTRGQNDGLDEVTEGGVLTSQTMWKAGARVWSKELFPSGALKHYWRQLPDGQVSLDLREDGRVGGLSCRPGLDDDQVLKPWCGYAGEKTVEIYDGTNKVSAIVTHLKGQKTQSRAGTSSYGSGSTVRYVEGKPDGEERISRPDGTLESTVTWRVGVKAGPEKRYSDDGQKLIEERVWRDDVIVRRTEYFLNGNKKLEEAIEGPRRQSTEYFDLGGVQHQGAAVTCRRSRGWCEDGPHRWFFESGKPSREVRYENGQRLSETSWYEAGVTASTSTWVNDRLAAQKTFFADGGIDRDEAFDADGSRKRNR